MAPVLQCPDCGQRHPLHLHDEAPTFRCAGCRRLLKVPEHLRKVAVAPEPLPWTSKPAPPPAPPTTLPRRSSSSVSVAVRVGLWVLSLPISLWLVYRGSRLVGLLHRGQVEDLFFDTAWGRFWPLVRLIPIWALLCAGLVHLGAFTYERWRRAAAAGSQRATPTGGSATSARTPARARTGS